jgi:hypothetical protein
MPDEKLIEVKEQITRIDQTVELINKNQDLFSSATGEKLGVLLAYVERIEQKQNELLGIVSDHIDNEIDHWAIKKEFITYARRILDRFVKKFMLFDDVNVKEKPERELKALL